MADTTNLVSHWKLNEGSGTRVDSHTNSYDLADNNTVTSRTGKIDDAASFDDDNSEFLSKTSETFLEIGSSEYRIDMWVMLDDKVGRMFLVSKGAAGAGNIEFRIDYDDSGDRFRFLVQNSGDTGTTSVSANTFGSPSIGVWIFLSCRHDPTGNVIGIQVNDTTEDTAAHSANVNSGGHPLEFGCVNAGVLCLDGGLDSISIWKGGTPGATHAELYNSGDGLDYPYSSDVRKRVHTFVMG